MFNKIHRIGDAIAKLRKEKGWTQIELAEKLQVSDKAVSKWESNKGDPSIEFLPMLAQLFDVTLDYLMTGKEQKENIVTMSKLELCAKKDDIELFKSLHLSLNYKDENNKTIFDYIFKYESKELFKFILPKAEHYISGHSIEFYENFYYMRVLCNDTTVVRDLVRLEYINTTLNNHIEETYKKHIGYNGSRLISVPRKIISDRIIDLILYNKNINSLIKSTMLSNNKDKGWISPALSYSYFVYYAAEKKDFKLVKELLENAVKINQDNAELKLAEWQRIETYLGFVEIPKELFDILLKNEKYDLVDLSNKNNMIYKEKYRNNSLYKDIFILSYCEIEANIIKNDKKLSDKEKSIKLCIHEGILNIDELLSTKDYGLIKDNLYKYPINYIEIFNDMVKKKNYNNLFKTAVDMGLNTDYIIKEKLEEFEVYLINEFWTNGKSAAETWNRKLVDEFKKYQETNFKYCKDWETRKNCRYLQVNKNVTINDILLKLQESRDIIIQNLAFEEAKNKITKDLSKEFFEHELENNNIDRVVINLCVKLEAILKYDYRYEGDFQQMLSKYCETFNTSDDECSDYDSKTPRLLNKLRMYRNGMVHACAVEESLTKEEIKYCINFICDLEKKGR